MVQRSYPDEIRFCCHFLQRACLLMPQAQASCLSPCTRLHSVHACGSPQTSTAALLVPTSRLATAVFSAAHQTATLRLTCPHLLAAVLQHHGRHGSASAQPSTPELEHPAPAVTAKRTTAPLPCPASLHVMHAGSPPSTCMHHARHCIPLMSSTQPPTLRVLPHTSRRAPAAARQLLLAPCAMRSPRSRPSLR